MIHFVPPHIEKVRAKVPDLIAPGRRRARQSRRRHSGRRQGSGARGLHRHGARACDFGETGLWTRINALNSPWVLDDITEIVAAVGDKLDVIMLPKVEGAVGHPLSRPAAGPARSQARRQQADPDPRHSRDRRGRQQCRGDRDRLAAHARHQPRPGRSRRLARDEDDARRRRPSRLQGAGRCAPGASRCAARRLPAGSLALHDRQDGRRLRRRRHQAVLRPVRRLLRPRRLRGAVPQRLPAWAAPAPGRCIRTRSPIAKRVFSPDPAEVAFAKKISPPCRTAAAPS